MSTSMPSSLIDYFPHEHQFISRLVNFADESVWVLPLSHYLFHELALPIEFQEGSPFLSRQRWTDHRQAIKLKVGPQRESAILPSLIFSRRKQKPPSSESPPGVITRAA